MYRRSIPLDACAEPRPAPDGAAPFRQFVSDHLDGLRNAATLLAGSRGDRLVIDLAERLGCEMDLSRRTLHRLRDLLGILTLEAVHDDPRREAAFFAAIDPASPVVEEICLLTDGFREALEQAITAQPQARLARAAASRPIPSYQTRRPFDGNRISLCGSGRRLSANGVLRMNTTALQVAEASQSDENRARAAFIIARHIKRHGLALHDLVEVADNPVALDSVETLIGASDAAEPDPDLLEAPLATVLACVSGMPFSLLDRASRAGRGPRDLVMAVSWHGAKLADLLGELRRA